MSTRTSNVYVTIAPVGGSGITELGMFNITVKPATEGDRILNLQYVVSVEGQPQGEFVAFVFIGNLPKNHGLENSIFYASCDAVNANRQGKSLTVQVAGAIDEISNPFDVSQTFTNVLWPQGSCS